LRRALACVLLLAAAPAAAAVPPCPPATDSLYELAALPHFARALKPKAALLVLVVGSATVFGPATTVTADAARKPAAAPPLQPSPVGFPWQAAHALEAAVPGARIDVTVVGKHGLTAAEMLELLRAELPRKPYRLVLWQTGTVEAVDELPPEDFYQTLADGAASVAAAGADLVLIDPQYSRFLAANANLEPYQNAFQAAASLPGVALFHRYDLMHDWAEDGSIDLERAPKPDRPATAARLHTCLGRELARELLAAAAE
jgi:hypothetical protein